MKQYELFDKITGKSYGIYSELAVKKIGITNDTFEIREIEVETELDRVKNEGRY